MKNWLPGSASKAKGYAAPLVLVPRPALATPIMPRYLIRFSNLASFGT